MSSKCVCCRRRIRTTESVMRGLGPICFARVAGEWEERGDMGAVDIPYDPQSMDIICRRDGDGFHFNIFQVFRHHSPTGFGWGYGGSGSADFSLNIMALFVNHIGARDVRLWDNQKISRLAWELHQRFKSSEIFGSLGPDGGKLKGSDIRKWIKEEQELMVSQGSHRKAA